MLLLRGYKFNPSVQLSKNFVGWVSRSDVGGLLGTDRSRLRFFAYECFWLTVSCSPSRIRFACCKSAESNPSVNWT